MLSILFVGIEANFATNTFTGDAGREADYPCTSSEKNGPKTWGPSCERECHCKHNEPCDSDGYCANGCERGWMERPSNGRCIPVNLWDMYKYISDPESLFKDTIPRFQRIPRPQTKSVLYRFSPYQACVLNNNTLSTTRWHMTIDPPVVLKVLKITFDVQLRKYDNITCTFHIKTFSNNSITKILTKNPSDQQNMFSMTTTDFIIADSLTISLTSRHDNSSCSPVCITGFFVQALPVCPYRKWGLRCNNDCQCPCAVMECHPTIGSCLDPGFACPPGKYGPSCSFQCSLKCGSYLHQCHVLTGICKDCNHPNLTGVDCQVVLSPDQQEYRKSTCGQIFSGTEYNQMNEQIKNEKNSMKFLANDWISVAIILSFVLVLTILLCCCYITTVQYCAKKRLKEYTNCMNEARRQRASMLSYSEFNKEFIEMEHYKKSMQRTGSPRHSAALSLSKPV